MNFLFGSFVELFSRGERLEGLLIHLFMRETRLCGCLFPAHVLQGVATYFGINHNPIICDIFIYGRDCGSTSNPPRTKTCFDMANVRGLKCH